MRDSGHGILRTFDSRSRKKKAFLPRARMGLRQERYGNKCYESNMMRQGVFLPPTGRDTALG